MAGAAAGGVAYSTWDLALSFWPLEERPEPMRHRATVDKMELAVLFTLKDQCESLAKKEGKGDAAFGRDKKLAAKQYAAAEDDCAQLLHPIRYRYTQCIGSRF
jgi:hypothetical protein